MKAVRVIKSFSAFTAQPDIEVMTDKAVTDFRAFFQTAQLHVRRVNDPLAIEVMLEVIEHLQNDLQRRKVVVK